MNNFSKEKINFAKTGGLLPVIIQDIKTRQVLMLGYMNEEALDKTLAEKRITFFSRTKGRLWTKGETSGHFLELHDLQIDCDGDTLLAWVTPIGPVCHTGTDTCFGTDNEGDFILFLQELIIGRRDNPADSSYTSSLFKRGINKVAQKVGEEAVELVIEAKDDNKDLFLNEAADLLYHYLILLAAKGYHWEEVVEVLRTRNKK
ncbi:MAG: bifunctional phosphoribosyl-AMP cyclohydrolase/phosphoribosyl-ATP diphosphatase HisIE [Saprospiraceae bacterium]